VTVGLTLGEFAPLHAGHQVLIDVPAVPPASIGRLVRRVVDALVESAAEPDSDRTAHSRPLRLGRKRDATRTLVTSSRSRAREHAT
jgi:hypothetical protein